MSNTPGSGVILLPIGAFQRKKIGVSLSSSTKANDTLRLRPVKHTLKGAGATIEVKLGPTQTGRNRPVPTTSVPTITTDFSLSLS